MASKKTEKFDRIIDAAVKVFAETGYHGSQVSKIAREAGVADGTIYLYFKSKEDILVSLFRVRLGELVEKFKESVEASDTADGAIRKICELHYRELESNPDFAYVTQIELRQSSLELRKAIGQALKPYIQLIEEVLVQGIEEGTFRQGLDVKLTRLLIFGGIDEAVTSWLISGRKYSLSAQINSTVEFFLKALKP
ncbi:TetR/AcrR family transcriptional regulator [Cohnella luojiensis]|uniref:TetR/AcrR family transcriptional regulator n=1 Tax=Cohnella luojiensis TaxID=652876 RepID=A0A4Y8M3X5_9BACL|nr:TetR/AcrR family transcriptional regulator [Cohnella luojiensis]TFE27539.1 TetR/AcrR family transcriptional regulator [Cohnella luojiensis]